MKTKGKKADKKKATSNKKEENRVVEAPAVLADSNALEGVLEVAPIEVLPEELAPTLPAIETRKTVAPEERRRLISMAAYYRAQRVGFGKTNPIEDWLLAEREIDAMMGLGAQGAEGDPKPQMFKPGAGDSI